MRRRPRANSPALRGGRHEAGGGGLGVSDDVFHLIGRGHAGCESAHEDIARAVRGNGRRRADHVVPDLALAITMDEAGAPQVHNHLSGDAGVCPFCRIVSGDIGRIGAAFKMNVAPLLRASVLLSVENRLPIWSGLRGSILNAN